jgi:hypothetical protein
MIVEKIIDTYNYSVKGGFKHMKKTILALLMVLVITLSACTKENKNYKIVGHYDKYVTIISDSFRMDDYTSYLEFTSNEEAYHVKAFKDLYVYDEAFFEENSLVYIAFKRNDSGFDAKLNSVNFIDNELVFYFSYKGPDVTTVVRMEMYLVEIKKSYLEDYPIRLYVERNDVEFDRTKIITDEIIPNQL